MRTKTMLLSALLGTIGSVSVMAQTNVYSLNAVGYVNVTCAPGFTMISCPLITTPDNTVGSILNNSNGSLSGCEVFFYYPSVGTLVGDTAQPIGNGSRGTTTNADGWALGGTNVAQPGVGFWFQNITSTNIVVTFVGQVPTSANYNMTNTLVSGFNLVSTILPIAGDIITNAFTTTNSGVVITNSGLGNLTNYNIGDQVFVYNNVLGSTSNGFTTYASSSNSRLNGHGYSEAPGGPGDWNSFGDPYTQFVGAGFWYQNTGATVNWVENYSVSQ